MLMTVLLLSATAQQDTEAVKSVINTMFGAMKKADTATLKTVFADSVIFQTVITGKDSNTVQHVSIRRFIASIGRLKPGAADERIQFDMVKTDGALASVWTPYVFYYNGAVSHCGVNSFQLVKIGTAWKIQYIIDTRRKEGCR